MSRKRCLYFMLGTIVGIHLTLFLAVNYISKDEDEISAGKFARKLKFIDVTYSDGKLGSDRGPEIAVPLNQQNHIASQLKQDNEEETFHLDRKISRKGSPDRGSHLQNIQEHRFSVAEAKRALYGRLFSANIGAESDSVCILPKLYPPDGICPETVKWNCSLSPTFSYFNRTAKQIHVDCKGNFRVNAQDSTEMEEPVWKNSYRPRPKWKHYEGPTTIDMDTKFIDVACKLGGDRLSHNYFTQFLPNPVSDKHQREIFERTMLSHTRWKPLSVLTIVLDSTSRSQVLRDCGLPKTVELLEKMYFFEEPGLSHQSFVFNRLNSISSSTSMNLTPLFSGELYDSLDEDRITKGMYKLRQVISSLIIPHMTADYAIKISPVLAAVLLIDPAHSVNLPIEAYAKDIQEWAWQYANSRGYITSYGVDNASGMMGTRTNCKDCHYRPPVLPHNAHGWLQKERVKMGPGTYSGLCEGNHFLHEHILNYTRDFMRHKHPAKWAALDLNAGHRREAEAINQLDEELFTFLKTVLAENENLVVMILGDHGKPYEAHPAHLGGHYETLLPFLSILLPSWLLEESPSIAENLVKNQQRYMVAADLHLSMKSLLHYPDLRAVSGARANNAVNIFSEEIPKTRACEDALMPVWSCVCGYMRKISPKEWQPLYVTMAHRATEHINYYHSTERLSQSATPDDLTSCYDISFKKLLHVIVNENPLEPGNSPKRNIFYVTFQAAEEDTVWEAVLNNAMDIYQVKQYSLYQKYDVCWDKRVPLPYCVCDRSKPVRKGVLSHLNIR